MGREGAPLFRPPHNRALTRIPLYWEKRERGSLSQCMCVAIGAGRVGACTCGSGSVPHPRCQPCGQCGGKRGGMAAMGGGCMKLMRVSVDMDALDDGYMHLPRGSRVRTFCVRMVLSHVCSRPPDC